MNPSSPGRRMTELRGWLVDYVPASSLYHIALCAFEHDRRRGARDPWPSNQVLQRPVAAMAGTSAHA